jgi:hypothetical protein
MNMRVTFKLCIAALFALPLVPAQDNDSVSVASFGAGKGCPKIAPGPVNFNYLAGQFTPQALPDPIATESIRQTQALYALAIDGRNYEVLRKVFTNNARANYCDAIGELNIDSKCAYMSIYAQCAIFCNEKEAQEWKVQVMEIMNKVLGEEHPSTLTSMACCGYLTDSFKPPCPPVA